MTDSSPVGAALITVNELSATTIATSVIAMFTIALFILQFRQHRHSVKVNRANYQLALFDKRMETYSAIEEFLKTFWREGQPKLEAPTNPDISQCRVHRPQESVKMLL